MSHIAAGFTKRYTTQVQITTAIDRLRSLMQRRAVRADKLDVQADHLFKEVEKQYDWDIQTKAREMRAKARRYRLMRTTTEARLKGLGIRLAEMQTIPMAGVIPDDSVPATLPKKI